MHVSEPSLPNYGWRWDMNLKICNILCFQSIHRFTEMLKWFKMFFCILLPCEDVWWDSRDAKIPRLKSLTF